MDDTVRLITLHKLGVNLRGVTVVPRDLSVSECSEAGQVWDQNETMLCVRFEVGIDLYRQIWYPPSRLEVVRWFGL